MQKKDPWYYLGVGVFFLPFVVSLIMFVWAYQTDKILNSGFWSGVVISALVSFLFIGRNQVKVSSGRIVDRHIWILLVYGFLVYSIYENNPNNSFIQSYVIPVFPICWSSISIIAMYKDRLYFFRQTHKKETGLVSESQITDISVSESGDDYPWIGGISGVIKEPYHKLFIRGDFQDIHNLSKIIINLSGGHNVIFYVLYEPKKGLFSQTREYAQRNQLLSELVSTSYGNSLAVSCKDRESMEYLLSNFWINEYIVWILIHQSSFTRILDIVHKTLNPASFPDNLDVLLRNVSYLLRDVEDGKSLLVVTKNFDIDTIKNLITQH